MFLGRLLDENDPEIQMKVLDCLLLWKDDFLLPYEQNLKNLICSKNLREELTTWSLSHESNLIEAGHRASIVPLAVRVLAPKVRKMKTLASRKVPVFLFIFVYYFPDISKCALRMVKRNMIKF